LFRSRDGLRAQNSKQGAIAKPVPPRYANAVHFEECCMPAMPLTQVAVHLRPDDNIAVAARTLQPGLEVQVNGSTLRLMDSVGLGHKLALCPIKQGQAITKYGQIIGFASKDIAPGEHVHVHNVSAAAFQRDYAFCRDRPAPPPTPGTNVPGSPSVRA